MDLKVYYQKLRETEGAISEPFVVIISLPTPDGGRAGLAAEAPKEVAARMIVNGRARLATEEEAEQFREATARAQRAAEEAALAERIQVTVVTEAEAKKGQGGPQAIRGK